PADRFHVVVEMRGALLEIRQIPVRQVELPALGIAPGELDEVGADRVADAAAAGVEHGPDVARLVGADLDEVVAAAQSAHPAHPVLRAGESRLELRMPPEDALQAAPERFRRLVERAAFLVLIAPDGNVARDLIEQPLEAALVEIIGRERRPRGDHAATDIHADGRGNDRTVRSDDRAHRRADARMNVGHRRDVMMHDRQLRHVDELPARLGLDFSGIDPDRDAALFDDLPDGHRYAPQSSASQVARVAPTPLEELYRHRRYPIVRT